MYKKTEETFEVVLFTSATFQVQKTSEVRVLVMTSEKIQPKKEKDLETEAANFNDHFTAKFNIKFLNGTRKTLSYLKFGVQAQVDNRILTFESVLSHPLVVITNEVQYEEADGALLKGILFRNLVRIFNLSTLF